jgi:hypothetical protein
MFGQQEKFVQASQKGKRVQYKGYFAGFNGHSDLLHRALVLSSLCGRHHLRPR